MSRPWASDPAIVAKMRSLVSTFDDSEGRSLAELLQSNDPLHGAESQRLRTYFSSNMLLPSRDLDGYGMAIFTGDFAVVLTDFAGRVLRLCSPSGSQEAARKEAAQEIFRLVWGPNKIPIYDLIFAQHDWKSFIPVDGTDLSGSIALSHAISTKPSYEPEFAQLLCDAGADINHRNRHGATAAHEIVMIWEPSRRELFEKASNALEFFLTHGGNMDVKCNDGTSPRILLGSMKKLSIPGSLYKSYTELIFNVLDKHDRKRENSRDKCCTFCGKEQEGLMVCSRCRHARYCAPPRGCQKGDWRRHKSECKELAAAWS
ncbi:hypothetical protein C8Q75DRAFT_805561 [Abortiporus biennis]|nr:hypothetical protein C8Q75DRAFT_805561 [Abortiporus biennis]